MPRKCGGKPETGKRAKPALIRSRIGLKPAGSLVSEIVITKTLSPPIEAPSTLCRGDIYLLSGASDASADFFQRAPDYGEPIAKRKGLFVVDKKHEAGHKYAVSSAIWFIELQCLHWRHLTC